MFAKKQPDQLRFKLDQVCVQPVSTKGTDVSLISSLLKIERDFKFNKISGMELTEKKMEILLALKKLGENLTPTQNEFLASNCPDSMKTFQKVSNNSSLDSEAILASASSNLAGII